MHIRSLAIELLASIIVDLQREINPQIFYTLFHESITAKAEHHGWQDDSSGQGVDPLLGGGDVPHQAGHRVQASHRGGQQVVSGLQLVRCQ